MSRAVPTLCRRLLFLAKAHRSSRTFLAGGHMAQSGLSTGRGSAPLPFAPEAIRQWGLCMRLPVEELGLEALLYRHAESGAMAMHVAKEDANKAFSVAFRTLPADSRGVAHILEHTALCGSAKYPVRDPFFKMTNRSLSTFMNAWTAADWTMYPFSTENATDYANLRSIYLDAVFNPLLAPTDFAQEGWRLDADEAGAALKIKGVVYNEMKGALSDTDALFLTRHQQAMFPGSTYEHVSGGDPAAIPSLTLDDLVRFHRENYHPSRAFFVSYGSIDVPAHLAALDEAILGCLSRVPALQVPASPASSSPMGAFAPFDGPRHVKVDGPLDPTLIAAAEEGEAVRQTRMLLSFLGPPAEALDDAFKVSLFASLLLDGPTSPMYKALIETNIGSDYAPGNGFDTSTATTSISVGLQGMRDGDVATTAGKIAEVISGLAGTGFPRARIEALLHQIEVGLLCHSASLGITLAQRATTAWSHGACPLRSLQVRARMDRFREDLERCGSASVFDDVIAKYFTHNSHRLLFVMQPTAAFQERLIEAERELTARLTAALTPDGLEAVRETSERLRAAQHGKEADTASLLPCLQLSDVPPTIVPNPLQVMREASTFYRESSLSRGMAHVAVKVALPAAIAADATAVKSLGLLTACLGGNVGTIGRPIEAFDDDVRMHTGGIECSALVGRPSPLGGRACGGGQAQLSLVVKSSCLEKNLARMLSLVGESISQCNWADTSRLYTVLSGLASSATSSLSSSGHSLAISLAAAPLLESRRLSDLLSGLEQVSFITDVAKAVDACPHTDAAKAASGEAAVAVAEGRLYELAQRLKALSEAVVEGAAGGDCKDGLSLALVSSDEHPAGEDCIGLLRESLRAAPSAPLDACGGPAWLRACGRPAEDAVQLAVEGGGASTNRAIVMPNFGTSFAGRAFCWPPSDVATSANLAVLSAMLPLAYLHKEIREKGGAYGGGCAYTSFDGIFSLYSYRDPSPLASVAVFDGIGDWIASQEEAKGGERFATEQRLLEGKLSLFSSLDRPLDVSQQGMHLFKYGIEDGERQAYRDAIFGVTVDSLLATARRFFPPRRADGARDVVPVAMHTVVLLEDHRPDLIGAVEALHAADPSAPWAVRRFGSA